MRPGKLGKDEEGGQKHNRSINSKAFFVLNRLSQREHVWRSIVHLKAIMPSQL